MNFQNASDTLERIASQYAGLVDAASAIKELGGLANAKDELDKQVKDLRDLSAQAKLDRDIDLAEVQKAKDRLDQIGIDSAAALNESITKANAKADEIIQAATQTATEITQAAQDIASQKLDSANAQVSTIKAKIESLTIEAQDKAKMVAELAATANETQSKLDTLRAAINKLAQA